MNENTDDGTAAVLSVDLAAIKAALDAATCGPWQKLVDDMGITIHTTWNHPQLGGPVPVVMLARSVADVQVAMREADAHLIANAPIWLRQLVAEVERLRNENSEYVKGLNEFAEFSVADEKTRRYILDRSWCEERARLEAERDALKAHIAVLLPYAEDALAEADAEAQGYADFPGRYERALKRAMVIQAAIDAAKE